MANNWRWIYAVMYFTIYICTLQYTKLTTFNSNWSLFQSGVITDFWITLEWNGLYLDFYLHLFNQAYIYLITYTVCVLGNIYYFNQVKWPIISVMAIQKFCYLCKHFLYLSVKDQTTKWRRTVIKVTLALSSIPYKL